MQYSVSLQATKTWYTGAKSHKFGEMPALKRTERFRVQLLRRNSLSLTLSASSHAKPLRRCYGHHGRSHRFIVLVVVKKCKNSLPFVFCNNATLKGGDAALRADHDTLVYTDRKIHFFRRHVIAYSSNLQACTPDTYRLGLYSARRSGSVVRVV